MWVARGKFNGAPLNKNKPMSQIWVYWFGGDAMRAIWLEMEMRVSHAAENPLCTIGVVVAASLSQSEADVL